MAIRDDISTATDNDFRSGSLIPARAVWERYGISDRSLDNWLADDRLRFPKPMRINGRRYFYVREIEQWERSRAAPKTEAA